MLLLAGAGSVHDATALNETRTLSFHHTHSDEDLTVTFKRDGRYDEEALKQLNHYLRDWRSQDQTVMDRHLFDILWEVYRDVDGKKPIQIISAYRSPATNAMLRRRSSGVARFSQHMLGHAMDFFIPDVPLEQIRFAGLRLQRGGVGFYPTSGSPFVHLDTGSIRHWPRMTHDQLVRVFPDGRTVHIPSDGTPLKGYELARADIEKRDGGDSAMTKSSPSLWAALFKGKSNDDEDEAAAQSTPTRPAPSSWPPLQPPPKSADPVPTPRAKPRAAATFQLASADAQIVQPGKSKPAAPPSAEKTEAKPQTPADIINARGFWGECPGDAEAGDAGPGRRPQRPPGGRRRRSAADRQRFRRLPGAGLCAGRHFAGRPRQYRGGQRADPAQRPPGRRAMPMAATEINTWPPRDRRATAAVIATSTRIAAAKGDDIWMRVMMLAPSASHVDVHDGAGRYRHDADARLFRQAAGGGGDGLLGRSADGAAVATGSPDRPTATLTTDIVRDADRVAALSAASPSMPRLTTQYACQHPGSSLEERRHRESEPADDVRRASQHPSACM